MFNKIRNRKDERASLPAIMGAAILISATAILLAAYSVATTRNAEVSLSKTSLNAAISNCQSTLDATVQKTFYKDVETGKSNLLSMADGDVNATTNLSLKTLAVKNCNYSTIKTSVRVTAAENYVPSDSTIPDRVKVTFEASYTGINPTTVRQVRYLKYPELVPAQKVTKDSFISSFDEDGNAVWVDLSN